MNKEILSISQINKTRIDKEIKERKIFLLLLTLQNQLKIDNNSSSSNKNLIKIKLNSQYKRTKDALCKA